MHPTTRLATTFTIGAAIAASLLPLPANAVRSAPCPAAQPAAIAPAVVDQPVSGSLLGMARETLGAWTAVPDQSSVITRDDPSFRQPMSATTRAVAAPLTVAELDARVSRYRRLPSSLAQPIDGPLQTLARQDVDNWAEDQACQP